MRRNKNGTILITSLWILTILSIFAIGIGFRASIEARLSKYNMDRLKALYLAKAGIYKAQAILSKDNNSYDSLLECGIILPSDKDIKDIFTTKTDDGAFVGSYNEEDKTYYGMMDEARKININKIPEKVPQTVLENLLGKGNEEVAASIINWRSSLRLPNGAGDDYYKSLTPPYECKHADFSILEELMLVKGVTPELFNSIKDYITIYGLDGKVNINTATKKVMLAMGLSEGLIDIIIGIRNGVDKIPGTKDDGVFTYDIAAQLSLPIDSPDRTILENFFTTKSDYFRIEEKGMVDNSKISAKIVCIVKKGAKKLEFYREY